MALSAHSVDLPVQTSAWFESFPARPAFRLVASVTENVPWLDLAYLAGVLDLPLWRVIGIGDYVSVPTAWCADRICDGRCQCIQAAAKSDLFFNSQRGNLS